MDYDLAMVKKVKLAEQNSKLERCLKIETELYGSVIIIVDFIYKNFVIYFIIKGYYNSNYFTIYSATTYNLISKVESLRHKI